jgi:hypothetical protein
MGPDDSRDDLFQRFEREVRTPRRPLLLDAFLPDASAIPSVFAPPPPPPSTVEADALPEFDDPAPVRDPEPEPTEPPRRAARRKRAEPPPKKESPKSLEQEIAEFMNRDQRGPSPDDDLSTFATSLDPNLDPEPGAGSGSKD